MKVIKSDIQLFNWQKDAIRNVLKYPHDVHVIKSKRQCGKSIMAEAIILKFAIDQKNSENMYVSPTFKQARKVYDELSRAIQKSSVVQKCNNSTLEIKFVNGSKITFWSAEQGVDALQGYTCKGVLIVDECAFIDDDIYYAITPWVDANRACTVCISTPKFKQGFFYELYSAGIDGEDEVHSFDFCKYDTTALLSSKKLEYYRKRLPRIKFIQQYLGEFADANGEVFGDFSKVLQSAIPYESSMNIVMGIDWGTGVNGDETAIAIFDKTTSRQIALEHFADKDSIDTIQYITDLIKFYKPIKVQVEKNSIGQVFYDLLKKSINDLRLSVQIIPFNTTNESKEKLVNKLQVAIQNGNIILLDDNTLVVQMTNYEAKQTANGKLQYGNGKGASHDDCVMATMLAYDLITRGTYSIR